MPLLRPPPWTLNVSGEGGGRRRRMRRWLPCAYSWKHNGRQTSYPGSAISDVHRFSRYEPSWSRWSRPSRAICFDPTLPHLLTTNCNVAIGREDGTSASAVESRCIDRESTVAFYLCIVWGGSHHAPRIIWPFSRDLLGVSCWCLPEVTSVVVLSHPYD